MSKQALQETLLPYHKALPATDAYIKDFEEKKEEYLKKAQDELSLAEANAIALDKMSISISANAQESVLFLVQ